MVLVEFVLMRDVPLSGGATRVFRHVTQLFNLQCLLALPKQHLPDFTLLICQERPLRSLSSTGMSFNHQGLELCGCGRLEPFVLILTPLCFAFRNLVPPEVTTAASSVRPVDKFGFTFPKTENEFSADRSFSMRGCSSAYTTRELILGQKQAIEKMLPGVSVEEHSGKSRSSSFEVVGALRFLCFGTPTWQAVFCLSRAIFSYSSISLRQPR